MYQPTPIQCSEVGYLYLVDGGWEIHRWRRYNMQVFGPYKTIQQAEKAARALGFGSTKVSREEELLRELADKQERAEHRRLWGR